MRRTISILLTALVAFGCAKEELAVLETSKVKEVPSGIGMSPINFAFSKGAENLGTKAASIDDVLPEDATLNVFADVYLTPAGGTKTLYVQNYLNGVKYDNDGNPVSGKYYWPESDDNVALDFYFVYPYKEGRTISNKSFEYTIDSDPSKQEDLLVASSLNTAFPSSTDGRVSVAMDHALSLLAFKAIAEESDEEYQVEGITISNESGFSNSGTYDFGSGSDGGWKDRSGSIKSIVSPIKNSTVTSKSFTDINGGDYCFLLPQDVSSMDIHVSYSVEKSGTKYTDTKVVTLENRTFEKGKKYTYGIKLPTISPQEHVLLWGEMERGNYYQEIGGASAIKNATGLPTIRIVYYYKDTSWSDGDNTRIRMYYRDDITHPSETDATFIDFVVKRKGSDTYKEFTYDFKLTEDWKTKLGNCTTLILCVPEKMSIKKVELIY